MIPNTLRRLRTAVVAAGLMTGAMAPAFAAPFQTDIDVDANETLNSIANFVDANDTQAALDLTNYLRYNCIRAIDVAGHRMFLVELEKYIAQPNPDVLVLVANRAEEAGPASFVRMSMLDCPANGDHNSSSGNGTPPDTPPPVTTETPPE